MVRGKFSSFWFLILILGVAWFLTEIGYINFDIPWLPVILIVFALGFFINRLLGR